MTSLVQTAFGAADPTLDDGAGSVPGTGRTTVRLDVDETDRCFYDHPLDHIPGMLLVTALLDLVRAQVRDQADAGLNRLRISLSFDRICEPGEPVMLHCEPAPAEEGPAWQLRAEQEGSTVCQAVVGLARTPAAQPVGQAQDRLQGQSQDRDRTRPADAALVHRHLPENILLGAPLRTEESAVLVPPAGHRLHGGPDGLHTPDALIESARQMSTLLAHTAHGREPDIQLLWLSLEADVPTDLPVSVPLSLRWEFTPARGARAPYPMALLDARSGERLGGIAITHHSMSRARYQERRAAK
ncbi:AfsA-related hotdog domain-containing protein [Streptomyces sp. NPDC016562]|uniref:AfsA-related hotdog domain-containing protein n=1 Tax=Streptomyces sp. NPDC016562 TaxID=3364966 RepID=UPI0036FADBAA